MALSKKLGGRLFPLVFTALAVLQLALFWSVKYPPQVDLPQHAAQITLWSLLDEPFYAARYEYNAFTPYLLCYVVSRFFDLFLPVDAALGVFTSLALLALPASLLFLLRRQDGDQGGDPWWSLVGFPLSYSFSFYWGLLNFLAAVPLALVLIALTFDWGRQPRWRRGAGLALLGVVLFLTHGLVCAFTLLVAGSVILVSAPGFRHAALRQWPLLPAAMVGVAWYAVTRRGEDQVQSAPAWNLDWRRVFELPSTLLGEPGDALGAIFGALLVVVLVSAGLGTRGSKSQSTARLAPWLPLTWALLFYFLGPEIYFRAAFLNARFAVFLLPAALFALRVPTRAWQRVALVLLAAGWLAVLYPRFQGFDREAREIDPVLAVMEPGREVLGVVYDPFPAAAIGAPTLLHHFAWYQAQKGGLVDFSFAYFYVQLIRYRPEHEPRVPDAFSWRPETFDWQRHGAYDYWLVRSAADPAARLFGQHRSAVGLRARSGKWWLYERQPPAPRAKAR